MNRRGYTLIEVMMATVLTLMVILAVVEVFARIGEGVTNARAGLEMNEELRAAVGRIKADAQGATVKMAPPRRPDDGEGYTEIIEGNPGATTAYDLDAVAPNTPDNCVGDLDDILMLTTRSRGEPFVGRYDAGGGTIRTVESHEAEVAYFVRGRTLYRRVLLIAPNLMLNSPAAGFYTNNDISVRLDNGVLQANTLADLTKPENRYAHRVYHYVQNQWAARYPYHPHAYIDFTVAPIRTYFTPWASMTLPNGAGLGLPTLAECSSVDSANNPLWIAGGPIRAGAPIDPNVSGATPPIDVFTLGASDPPFDVWRNPYPYSATYPAATAKTSPDTGILTCYHNPDLAGGSKSLRLNEDVLANNVLSFDVKVWDSGAPVIQVSDANGTAVLQPGDPGYIVPSSAVPPPGALAALHPNGAVVNPPPNTVSGATYSLVSYGAYVDLGYGAQVQVKPGVTLANLSAFSGAGNLGNFPVPNVYDTWSTHYEEQNGRGLNGFDNDNDGVVNNREEWINPPPYWAPLRGIQIKLRVFEPSSRQIREVTVVQEFLSK